MVSLIKWIFLGKINILKDWNEAVTFFNQFIGIPVVLKSVLYDDPKELVKYLTDNESVEDKANSSKSRMSFD